MTTKPPSFVRSNDVVAISGTDLTMDVGQARQAAEILSAHADEIEAREGGGRRGESDVPAGAGARRSHR
jgi:hypothetical protein